MPDILQDFPIKAPPARVFEAISAPGDLDHWWTKTRTGQPNLGATYELGFGPAYQWRAAVTKRERPWVRFQGSTSEGQEAVEAVRRDKSL